MSKSFDFKDSIYDKLNEAMIFTTDAEFTVEGLVDLQTRLRLKSRDIEEIVSNEIKKLGEK